MNPYQFTAKPIPRHEHLIVLLVNGGMEKFGFISDTFPRWPDDLTRAVIEQALIDQGYCLDACASMPAGGCFGSESICPPYASAFQQRIARG